MERGEVVEAGGDLALEALEASIEAELAGLGEPVLFSGGLEGWESNGEGAEGEVCSRILLSVHHLELGLLGRAFGEGEQQRPSLWIVTSTHSQFSMYTIC